MNKCFRFILMVSSFLLVCQWTFPRGPVFIISNVLQFIIITIKNFTRPLHEYTQRIHKDFPCPSAFFHLWEENYFTSFNFPT